MEPGLLKKFDELIKARGYDNRSEAIRDLIRDHLVGYEWQEDAETMGAVTIVYDHHVRDLTESLTTIQHDHLDTIISSMHVHVDHENCLEVVVMKGRGSQVRKVADKLISTKGVKHGKLAMTTTGKNLV